jgi:hypothetical protein
MTGPEHWREAERLLAEQGRCRAPEPCRLCDRIERRAQVHATLAVAEAIVSGGAMRPGDRDDWDRATGRLEVIR